MKAVFPALMVLLLASAVMAAEDACMTAVREMRGDLAQVRQDQSALYQTMNEKMGVLQVSMGNEMNLTIARQFTAFGAQFEERITQRVDERMNPMNWAPVITLSSMFGMALMGAFMFWRESRQRVA